MPSKRKISAVLLAALGVLLVLVAPASANRRQQTIFDASNDLQHAKTVAEREGILDQLQGLGVDTLRIVIPWRAIVPSPKGSSRPSGFDPKNPAAYGGGVMDSTDASVRGAAARGIGVLLTPSSPVPDWATASGHSSVAGPLPSEYQALLIGLGRRYGGTFGSLPCTKAIDLPLLPCLEDPTRFAAVPPIPRVGFWSLWNEPNLRLFLQAAPGSGSDTGALYRELYLAGQKGLAASGHAADPVLIGETSPGSGGGSTAPLDFLREVFCLKQRGGRRGPGCAPISAAGWAHHPYDPFGSPLRSGSSALLTIPSLGKLSAALGAAAKARATKGRLPIYVTEYGVESKPDRHGVPLQRQAEYLGLAEQALYANPQVRSYGQYLLSDDSRSNVFAFQTGLRSNAGAAKPSFAAFPITLVVRAQGAGTATRLTFWGHVRPGSGPVSVQISARAGGKVKLLRSVQTNGLGYFGFSAPRGSATRWQASAQVGAQPLRGPFVRAYPAG